MAKRASASKTGIIVTQEIKALILANKNIKGREVMLFLREKFPKETFNDKSCQVTYANIRKNLGLSRTLKRKPGTAKPASGRSGDAWRHSDATTSESSVDFSLLQAAKALLQQSNGDIDVAVNALKQIASLQMS